MVFGSTILGIQTLANALRVLGRAIKIHIGKVLEVVSQSASYQAGFADQPD
jgi:hypothetical protein